MTIGVEIEFTGISMEQAAATVAGHFGKTRTYYSATDNQGRTWRVENDSSINTENNGDQCELVTPILTESDIPTLQAIASELKAAGAIANKSCGLHVHIGADGLTATAIRNLVNNIASHEELLYKALAVPQNRKRYCRPTDKNFLNRLNAQKPATIEELKPVWYGGSCDCLIHYHESRYTICNLHALFTHGTVEIRIFNGTLDADEIKTAIQLSLALVRNAKASKRTIYKPVQTDNERFAMRTWLTRPQGLNLNGDEYATLRHHLTRNLSGNTAWRFAIA